MVLPVHSASAPLFTVVGPVLMAYVGCWPAAGRGRGVGIPSRRRAIPERGPPEAPVFGLTVEICLPCQRVVVYLHEQSVMQVCDCPLLTCFNSTWTARRVILCAGKSACGL